VQNEYTPSEMKHCWKRMNDTVRNKVLKSCMDVINDPKSSARDKGIAVKNLIMINKQNMELDVNTPQANNDITINIVEKDDIIN